MRALSGHRPQSENQKMFLPGADGVDESPDIIKDQRVSANQLKIGVDRDSGIYTSTWLIVGGHFNYSGSPLIKWDPHSSYKVIIFWDMLSFLINSLEVCIAVWDIYDTVANIYSTERQNSGIVPTPRSGTEMATPLLLTVLKLFIAVLFLYEQGRGNESLMKEISLSYNGLPNMPQRLFGLCEWQSCQCPWQMGRAAIALRPKAPCNQHLHNGEEDCANLENTHLTHSMSMDSVLVWRQFSLLSLELFHFNVIKKYAR